MAESSTESDFLGKRMLLRIAFYSFVHRSMQFLEFDEPSDVLSELWLAFRRARFEGDGTYRALFEARDLLHKDVNVPSFTLTLKP